MHRGADLAQIQRLDAEFFAGGAGFETIYSFLHGLPVEHGIGEQHADLGIAEEFGGNQFVSGFDAFRNGLAEEQAIEVDAFLILELFPEDPC